MNELIQQVVTWAEDRGILAHSTPEKQCLKFMYALGKFCDELAKENYKAAKMELGNVIVAIVLYFELHPTSYIFQFVNSSIREHFSKLPTYVLDLDDWAASAIIYSLAKEINSTPEECLTLALEKITKRKTKMVNGVAVKECQS